MTSKILKIIKTIIIVMLFLVYDQLIVLLLTKMGVDFNSFSSQQLIIIDIILNIIKMLVLYLIFRKDINSNAKDYLTNFKKHFFFGLKWWLIGLSLMIISNVIIMIVYPTQAVNEAKVIDLIMNYPLFSLFATTIVAPFTEELVFRKSIRESIDNSFFYVIVCGLLFGFIHLIPGFGENFDKMQLLYIIPYGMLGSIFAYIYVKTKNIFVPMTFHFIHNLLIVSFYIIEIV